jgi:hypothetical protein
MASVKAAAKKKAKAVKKAVKSGARRVSKKITRKAPKASLAQDFGALAERIGSLGRTILAQAIARVKH